MSRVEPRVERIEESRGRDEKEEEEEEEEEAKATSGIDIIDTRCHHKVSSPFYVKVRRGWK